jgi:hypothetical protein
MEHQLTPGFIVMSCRTTEPNKTEWCCFILNGVLFIMQVVKTIALLGAAVQSNGLAA